MVRKASTAFRALASRWSYTQKFGMREKGDVPLRECCEVNPKPPVSAGEKNAPRMLEHITTKDETGDEPKIASATLDG